MGFTPQGRGSRKKSISEINVTPLVDVMLVLLIIFMLTAPMMQQGIEVNLPKTSSTGISLNEEPFILVIKSNSRIYLGDQAIALDKLKDKLSAIFATRNNKQIYIQADKKVDYGTVAECMAEIKAAGIENIGLVTLPKD